MGRNREPNLRRSTIIYVGCFSFPTGDAAAARVLGVGKALRSAGFEVVFGGGEAEGRPEDRVKEGGYRYQGFEYAPQRNLARNHAGASGRLWQVMTLANKTLHWIEEYRARGVSALIAYEPTTPLFLQLRGYARRYGIPLILDIAEWYKSSNLPGGTLGLRSLEKEFRMRYLNRKGDGVIGISSFLAQYYQRAGCKTVRIPPLVDLEEPKWNLPVRESSGPLRLIYAGTPGKKDLLGSIIRGALMVRGARKIELNLVGVTKEEARDLCGCRLPTSSNESVSITCHGRIPQSEVPTMLFGSDFSVLLRPDEKYANAGFPTKLVESLSAGLPAIVNATSDIAEYVKNEREGLLVEGCSPEAFARAVGVAAALPQERIREMKRLAREKAENVFQYSKYRSVLEDFINDCSYTAASRTSTEPS